MGSPWRLAGSTLLRHPPPIAPQCFFKIPKYVHRLTSHQCDEKSHQSQGKVSSWQQHQHSAHRQQVRAVLFSDLLQVFTQSDPEWLTWNGWPGVVDPEWDNSMMESWIDGLTKRRLEKPWWAEAKEGNREAGFLGQTAGLEMVKLKLATTREDYRPTPQSTGRFRGLFNSQSIP